MKIFLASILSVALAKILQDLHENHFASVVVSLKDNAELSMATSPAELSKSFKCSQEEFMHSHYRQVQGEYVLHECQSKHETSQRDIIEELKGKRGVKRIKQFVICNAFVVDFDDDSVLEFLAEHPSIFAIDTNKAFTVDIPNTLQAAIQNPSFFNANEGDVGEQKVEWNIRLIGADKVWQLDSAGSRGAGTIYANADTGIQYDHPALVKNYRGFNGKEFNHNYSWFDGVKKPIGRGSSKCGVNSKVPCDDNGHGTHTLSTAVGANGLGVAPDSKWIGCRNMFGGFGSTESYLSCLEFFLAPTDLEGKNPKPELRPHVIGNSYGCPAAEGCSPTAFGRAVKALRAAGIFMSVSAGNEGPRCSTISAPPATEPLVMSVAATKSNDDLAFFSSKGPVMYNGVSYVKPEISAPGSQIKGAFPNNSYQTLSGTSMASPHIGGLVNLIIANCPELSRSIDKIEEIIKKTAVPLYPSGQFCGTDTSASLPNNHFGYGRIDAYKAVMECFKKSQ